MPGITVGQLFEACKEQIEMGNKDKIVCISSDDEGNSFHTLFYTFIGTPDQVKEILDGCYLHDDQDPNDIVLLG